MFKQFTPYCFSDRPAKADRTEFVACGPSQPFSIGFTGTAVAGVERITIERKAVPADVVKREAEKRCDVVEQQTGRRPKGKHLKEIKEEITREFLLKAFPKRKTVPVLWVEGYLLVGSTSSADTDAIIGLLMECEPGIKIDMLVTPTTPVTALTRWATYPDESEAFVLGRALTIDLLGGGKATFQDVCVYDPEVRTALSGATVSSLALVSDRDVEFTLTDLLQIKSLKVPGTASDEGHADQHAAHCHLYRGELLALVKTLVEALRAA